MIYNIYIDESCHLEHDNSPVMCIGYTKIKTGDYPAIKDRIKQIKLKHKSPTEIKWNMISVSRLPLYKELIDCFFETDIDFRCILVKYKNKLNHEQYNKGSHDTFYYKLVYFLLNTLTNPSTNEYKVFLDVKDTRGRDYLANIDKHLNIKHDQKSPFVSFQHIHSHENVLLQLTDLFIGAITYKSRSLHTVEKANKAKVELLKYLEEKSGYSLDAGTEPGETKFNIYDHQPKSLKQ